MSDETTGAVKERDRRRRLLAGVCAAAVILVAALAAGIVAIRWHQQAALGGHLRVLGQRPVQRDPRARLRGQASAIGGDACEGLSDGELHVARAAVVLSGHDSDLYRQLYRGGHRAEIATATG